MPTSFIDRQFTTVAVVPAVRLHRRRRPERCGAAAARGFSSAVAPAASAAAAAAAAAAVHAPAQARRRRVVGCGVDPRARHALRRRLQRDHQPPQRALVEGQGHAAAFAQRRRALTYGAPRRPAAVARRTGRAARDAAAPRYGDSRRRAPRRRFASAGRTRLREAVGLGQRCRRAPAAAVQRRRRRSVVLGEDTRRAEGREAALAPATALVGPPASLRSGSWSRGAAWRPATPPAPDPLRRPPPTGRLSRHEPALRAQRAEGAHKTRVGVTHRVGPDPVSCQLTGSGFQLDSAVAGSH